ncbi:uncharacterized protein LOC127264958 [Andrographis paniculata]|uniref:uncharacterized protein LOC127264958 n=1 Tax=Andrographis paniculata TaxID=175694 RepID=UPI0021E6E59F|nr:uncharacterized protein LOC127264958 [Andrographis paniculata]
MRPWMLFLVILLSIQIHESQGSRRRSHHFKNIQEFLVNGVEETNEEEKLQLHSSGMKNRKLSTITPISTSPTINPKKHDEDKVRRDKIGRKEENLTVNRASSRDKRRQPHPAPYPDTLDLSEMDYSVAKRKPPIHN